MKPKVFKKGKQWYFHIKADNGEIIAQSEGYKNKKDAEKTLALITKKEKCQVIIIPTEKWYQTIWASIKYNLPYALVGVGAGFLGWQLAIIFLYK